ncbi:MAG: hypothetical protein ACOYZ8_02335 [Chloroflexota bacterium]
MLDGLREDASTSQFEEPREFPPESQPPRRRRRPGRFLGMNAMQRFIISVFIMIITCMLGAMCLLLTGKFAI